MSTVNVALGVTETTNRTKRQLLNTGMAIPDVDTLSVTKTKLSPGDSLTLDVTRLIVCSVNVKILIQVEVEANTISFELSSSMMLPVTGTVTFTNPSNNPVVIPAVVSYVAI